MSEEGDILESELKDINSGGGGNGQLPNAVATLVLGIVSIVGCLFYGLPGLICGVIGLSLHSKDKKLYNSNKAKYESSYKMANAGYICAIIGTSLSALYFIIIVFVFAGLVSAGRF
ncbi:MAG: hypothetical protein Crog4KO_02000 [Crocinitomicaceae bacterium]